MTSQQSEPAQDLHTMKPVNTPAWSWGGTREPQPLSGGVAESWWLLGKGESTSFEGVTFVS